MTDTTRLIDEAPCYTDKNGIRYGEDDVRIALHATAMQIRNLEAWREDAKKWLDSL